MIDKEFNNDDIRRISIDNAIRQAKVSIKNAANKGENSTTLYLNDLTLPPVKNFLTYNGFSTKSSISPDDIILLKVKW